MPRRDTESASIATSFIISCEANSNRVVRSSNGEVDKNAHPYFVHDRGTPKPDFIVHVPGSGNNYAVIEVKSAMVDGEGIRDGIEKLVQFRGIGYQRAIYLFYGMRADQAVHRVQAAGITADQMAAIEVWVHPYPGTLAARAQ